MSFRNRVKDLFKVTEDKKQMFKEMSLITDKFGKVIIGSSAKHEKGDVIRYVLNSTGDGLIFHPFRIVDISNEEEYLKQLNFLNSLNSRPDAELINGKTIWPYFYVIETD